MKKCLGITLGELMIAIAVLTVLVTVAIPSFNELIMRNRTLTAANNLLISLMLARSEAIKRGQRVTVCKNNGSDACATSGHSNWDKGWIVFMDTDADGAVDASEEVLEISEPLPDNYTLRTELGSYTLFMRYRSDGLPVNTAGNVTSDVFKLCRPDRDTNESRSIIVQAIGRVNVGQGTTACP